jgi:hypothetical protein
LSATLPNEPPAKLPLPWPGGLAERFASRTAISIETVIGLLLIDTDPQGSWRVGQGRAEVQESLKLLSLPESYSTLTVAGLGTFVLSGSAEGSLSRGADGAWQIRLDRGRLAICDVAAGQRLNFITERTAWTALGVAERSTLAIVDEGPRPSLLVTRGTVAVEGAKVLQDQMARWGDDRWQPAEPRPSRPADSHVWDDGLNGLWLQPPDEQKQRQWQALHGRLVERIAAAASPTAAMDELFDAMADPQQAALLARWRLAVAADSRHQVQLAWDTLHDRREPVRQSAVLHLLDLPEGDYRHVSIGRFLRMMLEDEATNRLLAWLASTRANRTLSSPQAIELVDSLMYPDLGVRQIAVCLLELHARPTLERKQLKPPAYDAAAPASQRALGQGQWRELLGQLYGV